MANELVFSRDTTMTLKVGTIIYEIPVLSGFSFSQQQDVSELTLNEASASDGTSRRGRAMQVNAMQPGEFSFQTYIRPYDSEGGGATDAGGNTNTVHMVDEALWNLLIQKSGGIYTVATASAQNVLTGWTFAADKATLVPAANKFTLDTFQLEFTLNDTDATNGADLCYLLSDCVLNECTIDFDIEGIATATWSGFCSTIAETAATATNTANMSEGVNSTNNFIRNRLSAVTITGTSPSISATELKITGGSWTYSNNITYLTADELGKVNKPLVHVCGHKSISGSFTCYLSADVSNDVSTNIWEAIAEDTTSLRNTFDIDLYIGGKSDATTPSSPGMFIQMPTCHLQVPTHTFDELATLEITYDALPSTLAGDNEVAQIVVVGPTPN